MKTLVMEDDAAAAHRADARRPRGLDQAAGATDRREDVKPCAPEVAERHTGYQVGGTSPFGTRKPLPVYVERRILDLERVCLNGGRRGFLVSLDPGQRSRRWRATLVDVAVVRPASRPDRLRLVSSPAPPPSPRCP